LLRICLSEHKAAGKKSSWGATEQSPAGVLELTVMEQKRARERSYSCSCGPPLPCKEPSCK